jgi:hypothetical protein
VIDTARNVNEEPASASGSEEPPAEDESNLGR